MLDRRGFIAGLLVACLGETAFAQSPGADPFRPGTMAGKGDHRVRREGDEGRRPRFVRTGERIATFDNDGTLWCEQPMYFQVLFAFDRIKAMPPQHPEWKERAVQVRPGWRHEGDWPRPARKACSKSSAIPTPA